MNDHLQPLVAKQRIADQLRAAERARVAGQARRQRRDPRAQPVAIVRARLSRLAARLASLS
jgi:hypothetical protein